MLFRIILHSYSETHIFHVCPTINDDKWVWNVPCSHDEDYNVALFCAPSMFDDNLSPINQMQKTLLIPSLSFIAHEKSCLTTVP